MKIDDILLDFKLRRYRSVFDGLESFLDRRAADAKQQFRYAFFLRYYAMFENQLKVLCDRFADEMSLPLRLSDISGDNFLNRVNKYLTRVGHFDALDRHATWGDVLSYLWIRNLIIHNDGRVANEKQIPQYVSAQFKRRASALKLTSKRTIRLNRGFCYRAVSRMAALLFKIAQDGSRLTWALTDQSEDPHPKWVRPMARAMVELESGPIPRTRKGNRHPAAPSDRPCDIDLTGQ